MDQLNSYHNIEMSKTYYYCWRTYLPDGTVKEGCTDIQPGPNDNWPDLNLYGWVYLAIPLAAIFVFVFLFSCCCRGGEKKKDKQPDERLLIEDSVSEVSEYVPRPVKSSHYVPVRMTPAQNQVYNMMPYPNQPSMRKMPLQGGIVPSAPAPTHNHGIYPQLTTMKQVSMSNGGQIVNANGKVEPKPRAANAYVSAPKNHKKKEPAAPPSEEEYSESEYTGSEEDASDNEKK